MGDPTGTLLAGVNTGAFILCVVFLAYVLLIATPFVRRRPTEPGDPDELDWHLILPCLDEAVVIHRTVERLVRQVPTAHLWCVDDGSSDETPTILAGLAREHPRVHVVTRWAPWARLGKGAALNAAWRAIDGWQPRGADRSKVVVGVVDADGWLDPGCFAAIAGPDFFGNPDVGAVQVRVRMVDHLPGEHGMTSAASGRLGRALVRLQDMEFTTTIAAIQLLRRHIGSVGMGGNGQFTRLSVLNRIAETDGSPWHGALLEDLELGLHVLLSGSRTEYCHDAWVAQQALPTVSQLVRQRCRWAQGSMQCIRYLGPVLRSPSISTPGALEIAHFLLLPWLQLLGSLLYLVCLGVLAWFAVSTQGGPAEWFANGAWGIVPLFLLFGLAPLAVWGPLYWARTDRRIGFRRSLLLGVANWPYTYVHQAAVWWAFARVVRNRHDWKKTARQPVSLPAHLAASGGVGVVVTNSSPTRARGAFRPRDAHLSTGRPFGHLHRARPGQHLIGGTSYAKHPDHRMEPSCDDPRRVVDARGGGDRHPGGG